MLSKDSTIMLVDDSRLIRSAVKKYLVGLGYKQIIEAEDGQEAVDKHTSTPSDFIFMDIVMPNLAGNHALAKIRESDKSTPVVMLTSVSEDHMIKECEGHGILGYILKPINQNDGPTILSNFLEMI